MMHAQTSSAAPAELSSSISPQKKVKISEHAASPVATNQEQQQQDEELAQAFSCHCTCRAGAGVGSSAASCLHLDTASINQSLPPSLLPVPLSLHSSGGRLFSAPASSSSRCQCIPLPPPASATSVSHKRRHVSPALTPVAKEAQQLQLLALASTAANVVPPLQGDNSAIASAASSSSSSSAAMPGRTIIRVRKSHHSSAPRSPCSSLTVELPEDDDCSVASSPSPLVLSPSSGDSPLPAATRDLYAHAPGSSNSSVAAAPAAAPSSSATDSLFSSPLLQASKPSAAASSSSCAVVESWHESASSDLSSCDSASMAEIRAIEQEENEQELNFLMEHMNNQSPSFMPYIL